MCLHGLAWAHPCPLSLGPYHTCVPEWSAWTQHAPEAGAPQLSAPPPAVAQRVPTSLTPPAIYPRLRHYVAPAPSTEQGTAGSRGGKSTPEAWKGSGVLALALPARCRAACAITGAPSRQAPRAHRLGGGAATGCPSPSRPCTLQPAFVAAAALSPRRRASLFPHCARRSCRPPLGREAMAFHIRLAPLRATAPPNRFRIAR
jgi:hypothetical protein